MPAPLSATRSPLRLAPRDGPEQRTSGQSDQKFGPSQTDSTTTTATRSGGDASTSYSQTSTDSATATASQSGNAISGAATATTTSADTLTLSETGTYAATGTTYQIQETDTSSATTTQNLNAITGADTLSASGATTTTLTETGGNGAGSYNLTEIVSQGQSWGQSGNDLSGGYSGSGSTSTTTTTQETDTAAAASSTWTETSIAASAITESGNSISGDYSRTTTSSTTTTLQDSGSDAAGAFTVSESDTGSSSRDESGNAISGGYSASTSSSDTYSMSESVNGSADSYQVTESGTLTTTGSETGNSVQATYSRSQQGSDVYALSETGSAGGGYTESIQGSDNYTLSESGDQPNQSFTRTVSGSGAYTLQDSGPGATLTSGSGNYNYTVQEQGSSRGGSLSQSETGSDRYGLLQGFDKVANASNATPGHLDFSPVGLPFTDPPPEGMKVNQEFWNSLSPKEQADWAEGWDKLTPAERFQRNQYLLMRQMQWLQMKQMQACRGAPGSMSPGSGLSSPGFGGSGGSAGGGLGGGLGGGSGPSPGSGLSRPGYGGGGGDATTHSGTLGVGRGTVGGGDGTKWLCGAAKTVLGGLEFAGGVVMAATGVGAGAGVFLMWHGLDVASSGVVETATNGEQKRELLTVRLLKDVYGLSQRDAETMDTALSIVAGTQALPRVPGTGGLTGAAEKAAANEGAAVRQAPRVAEGKPPAVPEAGAPPAPKPQAPAEVAPPQPAAPKPSEPAALPSKSCFPAGTPVHVSGGLKAIEEVAVGERVWSYDHKRLCWAEREVVEVYQLLHQGTMATLKVEGETLRATGGHPFWVVCGEDLVSRPSPVRIRPYELDSRQEGRWVLARHLRAGDAVLLRRGSVVVLESVRLDDVEERVYNFHVAELQNYAVGGCGVLVHNVNDPAGNGRTPAPEGPVPEPKQGELFPEAVPAEPPPGAAPKAPLTRGQRLGEYFDRLGKQPASRTAEEALGRVGRTLDEVEDALSGIPKKTPPPPPKMPDGRMYPPQADNIIRNPDGSISARTAGHRIEIGADGSITIRNIKTGEIDFHQPGGQ
jgi:hypothetical protein